MATLANLRVNFGANTAGFEAGAGRVRAQLGGLLSAAVALAGTAGLGALTMRSLDAADNIQKLGIETGLTAEFLSTMRHGAALSGTSLEALTTATVKLQRRTEKAIDGTKSYASAFEKLGISAERFKALSPDEQIRQFAEAYSKLQDETTKTTVLTELMGVRASKLKPMFEQGAAGIDALIKAGTDANMLLSQDQVDASAKAKDAIEQLTASWKGLIEQATIKLAPEIVKAVEFTGDLVRNLDKAAALFKAVGTAIGGFAAGQGMIQRMNPLAGFRTQFEASQDVARILTDAFFGDGQSAKPNQAEVETVKEQRKTNQALDGIWMTLKGGKFVPVAQ